MKYTDEDVRAVESVVQWRVMSEVFPASVKSLPRDVARGLSRGIVLMRDGAALVVADDPDGEYDSPRLPDITNQVFGGDYMIALRYCPEAQP